MNADCCSEVERALYLWREDLVELKADGNGIISIGPKPQENPSTGLASTITTDFSSTNYKQKTCGWLRNLNNVFNKVFPSVYNAARELSKHRCKLNLNKADDTEHFSDPEIDARAGLQSDDEDDSGLDDGFEEQLASGEAEDNENGKFSNVSIECRKKCLHSVNI
jgi:hypothetical protein